LLVFILSAVNVMNTAFCSIISLCDKPRGLNQSCRLELSGTTFLLHHCVIHKSLAFFFSSPFLLLLYLSSSLSFVRVSMSLTPFPLLCFLPFSFHFFRLSLLPFFAPFLVSSYQPFFLSFFQPVFSMFPFCLALFLAVFLSVHLPFQS